MARINRGIIYGQRDNLLAEIEDYTAALKLPSLSAEQRARALVHRGIAYRSIDQGKPISVRRDLADYNAVIAMPDAPLKDKAKALVNRGAAYGNLGLYDLEIADYNAVLQADVPIKERAQALVRRGAAYGREGHFELELADYDALLNLPHARSKERGKALLKRASAYLRSGKIELAIAEYTEVAKAPNLRPDQRALALAWARFLVSPTDSWRLIEDSQTVLALAPDLTAARFQLGLGLLLAGQVKHAVEEYGQAAERETTTGSLREARQILERFADRSAPATVEILSLLRSREVELEKSGASYAEPMTPG
jgi:tetratricopeptide (TPR) repeat protein